MATTRAKRRDVREIHQRPHPGQSQRRRQRPQEHLPGSRSIRSSASKPAISICTGCTFGPESLRLKKQSPRSTTLSVREDPALRLLRYSGLPVAQELGIAVCPWSPLAGGLLSGKYKRQGNSGTDEGRLEKSKNHPIMNRFNERNRRVVDALVGVSTELGKPLAQVARNYLYDHCRHQARSAGWKKT